MKTPALLKPAWRWRSAQPFPEQLEARVPAIPAAVWRIVVLLAFASGGSCLLWAIRVAVTGRLHHVFLPWNLVLAWLPLVLAMATLELARRHGWRSWRTTLAAGGWLLFFPNAPYLLTDLVHLRGVYDHRFWVDLIMILIFAWPGFLAGCLSLRLLHEKLADHVGGRRAWIWVGLACGLAGAGVYIGRFLRWNSWDVVTNPVGLAFDLLGFFGHPVAHPAYRFTALFGLLLFFGYVTLGAFSQSPAERDKALSVRYKK